MQIQSLYAQNAGSTVAMAAAAGSAPVVTDPIQVDRRGQGHHDRHHEGGDHGHGGGRMHHALAQALQSLGLSLPQRGQATAPAPAPAPAPAATDGTTATTAATGTPSPSTDTSAAPADPRQTIRADVHDFMHALFRALRDSVGGASAPPADTGAPAPASDATSTAPAPDAAAPAPAPAPTPATPPTTDSDGDDDGDHARVDRHELRDRFTSALSTLIGQVGSGNAPAGLQSAFDKLVSDLQSFGRSSTQPAPDPAAPKNAPTLQQLLTALQQQTGYGQSNGCGSVGNTINVTA